VSETIVGVRELKAKLGHYLRRVRQGETVVVTDRGKPIGRIVPFSTTPESRQARALELAGIGLIEWNGETLSPIEPAASLRGSRTVAELLIEDRE